MKPRLLPYLRCPNCLKELSIDKVGKIEGEEIMEGELRCASGFHTFSILRGVPRFTILSEVEVEKAATASRFGWSWQHFDQFDERYAAQFLGWISPVTPQFFKNKIVLEGGCGKGRHTQLAARWGAQDVIGVDLSNAVDTAFAWTRDYENAHIVQGDIYNLPLASKFDYAFSVGVLHHLGDPRAGFISLSSKVKPSGHLSAWVYGAENNGWITRWVNPLRERLTSRINPSALLHLSKAPTAMLYLATKLVYGPLNRIPAGASLARRLFYNDYLAAISDFDWREHHTIVFDHLVAPTAFYISREEFASWWTEIRATEVKIRWHNRNSWCGWGRLGSQI
jgi:SAM-dependent methyltransferase